jgi:hypothetical protein
MSLRRIRSKELRHKDTNTLGKEKPKKVESNEMNDPTITKADHACRSQIVISSALSFS